MTIALELPQTTDLLDPTTKLSSGFFKNFPIPIGLWCPSKLNNVAVDFNPLKKNFGTLNGGVTVVPGGFGVLGQRWQFDGTVKSIQHSSSLLSGLAKCTFVFALTPTAVDTTQYGFFSKSDATSNTYCDGIIGVISSGDVFFRIGNASNEYVYTAGGTVAAGAPSLLCLVYDGTLTGATNILKIYVNGTVRSTTSGGGTPTSTIPTNSFTLTVGRYFDQGVNDKPFKGGISLYTIISDALSPAQVSSLYNALLTGEPYPIFEPDILYIDSPSTTTTINLTSKSFVFTSSNSQESVQRPLSSQEESQTDSLANITFTRPLNSKEESQTFSTVATSILRPSNSKAVSLTEVSAARSLKILYSSIAVSQAFANGKFIVESLVSLESKVISQSFSLVEINLSRKLGSTVLSASDLIGGLTRSQSLDSIAYSQSKFNAQESILRLLNSKQISLSDSVPDISIQRPLSSEILSSTRSASQFTTQLYTKFEVLSFRRYSSQYFVQSGSVNDSGK